MIDPCPHCGGVEEHDPTRYCLALASGAPLRRVEDREWPEYECCRSTSPYNHSHRCTKPRGHHTYGPNDDEGFSTNYPPDPECLDETVGGTYAWNWADRMDAKHTKNWPTD